MAVIHLIYGACFQICCTRTDFGSMHARGLCTKVVAAVETKRSAVAGPGQLYPIRLDTPPTIPRAAVPLHDLAALGSSR